MKKEDGFSFIEVMIAVTIFTTGLLAVGSGEMSVLTLNKRTSEIMRAKAVAENIIDLMRRNSDNIKEYENPLNERRMLSTDDQPDPPVTQKDFDFIDWKRQVLGVSGNTTLSDCRGVKVSRVLGTVLLQPGPMDGVTIATVTIVWPTRPCGITLTTTIAGSIT